MSVFNLRLRFVGNRKFKEQIEALVSAKEPPDGRGRGRESGCIPNVGRVERAYISRKFPVYLVFWETGIPSAQ